MYSYTLPNGIVINSDALVDAVLVEDKFPITFLDIETGALVQIPSPESLAIWVKEIGKSRRYFVIEHFDTDERESIAHSFIEMFLEEELSKKGVTEAKAACAGGNWITFAEYLIEHTDGWIHGWHQYVQDAAWEYVHDWLVNHPHVDITESFEGCGDCAICQAMADGKEPNFEELQKLFETEAIMQHVREQVKEPRTTKVGSTKNHGAKAEKNDRQTTKKSASKSSGAPADEATDVLVFKVSLEDVIPKVWRRLVVPGDSTFYDLHCAIQDAFGWEDSHLHSFRVDLRGKKDAHAKLGVGRLVDIMLPHPDRDDFGTPFGVEELDERTERLRDWFGAQTKQCMYEYDFGDSWEHIVMFEKHMARNIGEQYPQCIGGKNACPPEDCGGAGGYAHIKDVLTNRKHEEYDDMVEWLALEDEPFDPTAFDPKKVVFRDSQKSLRRYEKHTGI